VNARAVNAWLDEFGAAHHGIISGRAAAAAGISAKALRHRTEIGQLRVLGMHVLQLRSHPETWHSRLWAAVFEAGPGAVVGLRSAGRLHGLWRYRDSAAIEVVIRRGGNHRSRLGRLVETSLLDADHVCELEGFPVTTLARTVFDLLGDPEHRPLRSPTARQWHKERMLAVVNDAMRHHGLTVLVELAVLGSIGRRGRPGTALVREIFEQLGNDYVPDESQVESVFSALLLRSALPQPVKQLEITDHDGFIGRVDFAWPDLRLVVEIDSTFHDGPLDRRRDSTRDARLAALGYLVLRFRWPELVTNPDGVLRKLRRAARRLELPVISAPQEADITAHS
jgi:very-short-patch-repair endonuclease